jgi:LDH2 family malate/lactate/ureidoglycolate dehydrogenase
MPDFTSSSLHQFACDLLVAAGTPDDAASTVADSLIDANLTGHDSHGVLRLLSYLDGVRLGHVNPLATPVVISESGATAIVDASNGWGQPAMWLATQAAIARSHDFGLGASVVRRSYHIGRVAPYVEKVATQSMIGIAMANAAPAVAPFGGRSRIMGTNPFAWAVPRGDGLTPVCLDVATAGVAEGKLRVARAKGLPVPAGNIVDRDGLPSTDPQHFYDGGALLTFGGHKGSGIGLLVQLIGLGLAGLDTSVYDGPRGVNGPFILAIDVSRFTPFADFSALIDAQLETFLACKPAEGFTCIQLPGQPEIAMRSNREHSGIPIPETTWSDLTRLASEYGVPPPPAM